MYNPLKDLCNYKMTGPINDVQREFREFWELSIDQDGKFYSKSTYDSVNSSLIFERLAETSSKDDLALVCPDDPTNTLLIIIESLLALLKYDMLTNTSEVLSTIKEGDTVALIGATRKIAPGIYTGTEEIKGKMYHRVRTDDGLITKIPPDRGKWRIQPYTAAATLAGKKRVSSILGEKLEELAGLPPGGFMAFQQSKALLVTPEKARIKEALRGVAVGGDPIEAVFPMTDYTDADNRNHIGRNALQREPVLGLVSHTDVAVDIALRDPAIKLLIIDGAAKIRSQYGSIERLNGDSVPRKIICLLKSVDEEEVDTLTSLDIDTWIWKRDDFRSARNELPAVKTSSGQPFDLHGQIMRNLAGSAPQFTTIAPFAQLDEPVHLAVSHIKLLSKKVPASEEAGFIFRWAVSLINSLLQLPVKMSEFEAYIQGLGHETGLELNKKINSFENKVRESYGFVIPSVYEGDCEKLIGYIWDIYTTLSLRNPKAEALERAIENFEGEQLTVICTRSEYAGALREVYASDRRLRIISMNEAGAMVEENAIMTGWLNRRIAARLFLAPYRNLEYLLYPREEQSYSRVLKSHPCSPVATTDKKLRELHGMSEENQQKVSAAADHDDIDSLLNSVNSRFGIPSYSDQLQTYSTGDTISARRVMFEDDSYAYFTDTQGLYKLTRDSHGINKCRLSEISTGDELVFVESERDMFEEQLAIIQETETYQELNNKAKLWHQALQSYIEKNHLTEQQLAAHLALVGTKPDSITLRNWINGTVISPAKDSLHAIAKVTNDPDLKSHLGEVMESCSKLYSLHIQTGRLLVRHIIKSAASDGEDMLSDEAKVKIDAYSRSARIVTVREVTEEVLDVPVKASGKIFEL